MKQKKKKLKNRIKINYLFILLENNIFISFTFI